jgi:EAL domain-containing protein (putative c-di-GMP-specific phosphodiesterase class I)/GGDEF domain-containing protein
MDVQFRTMIESILASGSAEVTTLERPEEERADSRICDTEGFTARLEQALHRADRSPRPLALLLLQAEVEPLRRAQVSGFGHEGAETLMLHRVAGCMRRSDSILSCGAGLFAILLEDLKEPRMARFAAEKLHDTLSLPFALEQAPFRARANTGISVYPADGQTINELWNTAQVSLAHARLDGGGRIRYADPELDQRSAETREMGSTIHRAYREQQFELLYHPQWELDSGRVARVEALLRWQHPEQGRLTPDRFLSELEESGLGVPVGAWVLESACRQAVALGRAGHRGIPVTVNLGERQLLDPDFLDQVDQALSRAGCAPQYLEIECSEDLLSRHFEAGFRTIKGLGTLGVGVWLDHFAGRSPMLTDLLRLPLRGIKLDRTLVRQLACDRTFGAVGSSLLALAEALELRAAACGVQYLDQLDFLRERRCQEGQGFLFTPPVEAGDLADWLPG